MKKWKIENSEKSEISKISEKLLRVFLFLSFRFCSTAKIYIENSEKLEISEISEKLFRVSLFPSFRFCPTAKLRFKNLGKNFRDFGGFPVSDLVLYFKDMPNSIDFYKRIFLHVIPVRIIVP